LSEKSYIVVEGVIGAGKTSLAKLLATELKASVQLEVVEKNPFLEDFYRDMRSFAFQTQIFFLLSRYKQQMELVQRDLFSERVVSDYLFAKDRIFANLNLDDRELVLYDHLADLLERDIPKPDVVVYLQASTDILMKRIRKRGRSYEHDMPRDYIAALNEAYNYFFFHYNQTPLLVVNTDDIDFVANREDLKELIQAIDSHESGTSYYLPVRE
jgi:deoxyadenosine/deoxycytidine kinase